MMMMPDMPVSYPAAFLVGLLGSTHCIGMCGGISASLSMALPTGRGFRWRQLGYLLCFNGGRIGSYVLLTSLLAFFSTTAVGELKALGPVLRSIAAALLILMGLSIGQWWQGISAVERVGAPLWRRLSPLTGKLLPIRHAHQSLMLGVLWGWLPCGLVYSTLAWAALQPTVPQAMLTMLFFGLGTLPSMLLTGMAAQSLQRLRANPIFRRFAGVLMIGFGIWTIPWMALSVSH